MLRVEPEEQVAVFSSYLFVVHADKLAQLDFVEPLIHFVVHAQGFAHYLCGLHCPYDWRNVHLIDGNTFQLLGGVERLLLALSSEMGLYVPADKGPADVILSLAMTHENN